MRVVVVGGGKVGGYVARQLAEEGHAVSVIELDPARAHALADTSKAVVIEGDGTSIDVLRQARVDTADWILAVTGKDEVNLVACELGSTLTTLRTLARLNEPRNRATFAALGIQAVAVTDLMGEVFERELETDRLERVTILGSGRLSLVEVDIPDGAPARRVSDLDLPEESILVAIRSGADTTVPGAEDVIRPGDRVVVVTTLDGEPLVRETLCETGT